MLSKTAISSTFSSMSETQQPPIYLLSPGSGSPIQQIIPFQPSVNTLMPSASSVVVFPFQHLLFLFPLHKGRMRNHTLTCLMDWGINNASASLIALRIKSPFSLIVIPGLIELAPCSKRGNPVFLSWIPAGVYPDGNRGGNDGSFSREGKGMK